MKNFKRYFILLLVLIVLITTAEYFYSVQGCDYGGGKIFSVEGFNSGSTDEPALRIVDLNTKKLKKPTTMPPLKLRKNPRLCVLTPLPENFILQLPTAY